MDKILVARFITPTIFALLAALFAATSAWGLLRGGLVASARTRLRLAAIVGLVSLLLFWLQSR